MGSRNNKPGRIVKGTAPQPSLKSASGIWSLDEAMQAHRANAWPQPNLFQPVSNSLRFDGSRNTFLSKAISRSGNRQTWTWSGWFKPSKVSDAQYLFVSTNTNGNPFTYLYFSDSNFIWWEGGQTLITTAKYRDTSAWYHVVLAVDTTQATAANRGKLYINGVQVTGFAVSNYPTQGQATYTNSNASGENIVYIGAAPQYVTGYLGEVNFVDGYQLDPSLLGKFDTNNTWVPVPYTGSYGTNGFYLPFTNATTSQTLGYDASLNGTATYDADQDPYRGSVALHLTGNGPAGGNNNVFSDSSPNNLAITRVGTATQGSFSPFPLNTNTPYNPATHGASAYLNGASTLSVGSFPAIGTQDFTVECWVYAISTAVTGGSNPRVFDLQGTQLVIEDTGRICRLDWNDSNVLYATGSGVFQINQWNHIAVVRISNIVSFYLNGVAQTGGTRSENLVGGTGYIGTYRGGTTGFWNGYISGFRATIGKGIYTAAFTPTMRPFGTLTNNLLTFSEDFANSVWTGQSAVVGLTTNAAIAPDGTPSATLLVPSTSSAGQNIAGLHDSAAGVNTFSIYAKSAGYRYMQCFHSRSAGGDAGYVTFDLTTGTVTNSSVWSGSIVNVGNGWYRIIATTSSLAGASANSNVRWAITDGSASRAPVFTGNGSSGIYVWGAQAELASSVGDYTPTPANFRTAPSLLLNFANAAVVDSAGTNIALTGGNATISSASKYGSGAMTFTADGYLSFAPGAQYAFGTGDFTIEAWVRTTETTGDTFYRRIYMTDGPTGNAVGNIQLTIAPSTGYANLWENSGGLDMLGTTNISTGAWFHIAATRVGTTLRLFVNGKQEAISSHNTSIAPNSGTPRPWVGAYNSSQGRWNGQIDDLRVTKGVARYTTDFTPPARALPETGGKSFVTTNVNAGVAQRFVTVGTTSWTAPTDVTSVEVLVVAGGGAGGNNHAGGGGGGGLIYNNQYPVVPGQTYTVTVGSGGLASGTGANNNTNGGNSQFGALTAIGGGAGGNRNDTAGTSPGQNGGSGGGGGGAQVPYAGCYVAGLGTAGQGFSGGVAVDILGGGGGGAGGVGAAGVGTRVGGNGLQFGISGTPQYYAGGGGGSNGSAPPAAGGLGGGGTSGTTAGSNGTAGTANTGGGGGGGGAGNTTGSNGGSGIVIVRYTTTAVGNTSDATTDNLVDSPTLYGHDTGAGGEVVGNYATWNPLDRSPTAVLSNGNLDITPGFSTQTITRATMSIPLGQWYFEVTCRSTAGDASAGEIGFNTAAARAIDGGYATWAANSIYYTSTSGNKNIFGTSTSYGATWTANDIIGVAIDTVAGTIVFYKNGASQGTITDARIISNTLFPVFANNSTSGSRNISANFGQRAWAYAPPAGYNALTTKNFARPAVGSAAAAPNEYFDAVTWTGTGAAQTITLPGAFQPDLVWTKSRSFENNHHLFDSVRGSTVSLKSNTTAAEDVRNTTLQAFNSNGFSLGSAADVNGSGSTYVAWCWRAGGAAVSNTSGTLTSQVSANTASGFSVVTYTGTATSGATVGHGLSAAPELIITKVRNQTDGWYTYTTVIDGSMDYFFLNTSAAKGNSGLAVPTSTVFYNDGWSASYNMLAYCFHSVPGYSKIGTYVGNGSADGPFVYTGFRPAFILTKDITTSSYWWEMVDSARAPFNPSDKTLYANVADSEYSGSGYNKDLLSNGFKIRGTSGGHNTSGSTYIYMAFAGKPFGNVNGVAR